MIRAVGGTMHFYNIPPSFNVLILIGLSTNLNAYLYEYNLGMYATITVYDSLLWKVEKVWHSSQGPA